MDPRRALARLSLFALPVLLLAPSLAHADVRVTALDGREWPALVAALQSDVSSQGRAVALCIRDDTSPTCSPCGTYSLAFDAEGTAAFRVASCDPATGATEVWLADRSALFDHTHAVPRPRTITVRAAITRSVQATGGAASTGGSEVGCLARVRPSLRDLEHGVDVFLGPDHYDVRVTGAGASAVVLGEGWTLVSEARIEGEVDYEVVERATGEVVMTGHTSLVCASDTTTSDAGVVSGAIPSPLAYAEAHTEVQEGFTTGTLRGLAGGATFGARFGPTCIGSYPEVPQHVLRFAADAGRVRLHAGSDEGRDLTLAVRDAEGVWHCNDDGHQAPSTLDPIVSIEGRGDVEVWVGTYSGYGGARYTLDVRAVRIVHGAQPEPSLFSAGVLAHALSWVFMVAFDLLPEMWCADLGACPNDTWRAAAWLPFVGPLLAENLDGARGGSFTFPAMADMVLQDVGLVLVIIAAAIGSDREVTDVALGDAEDAPRLAFHGGAGSALGLTLTF